VVGIYVIYWDGSKDVSVPLKVTIQDCACCSALVSASPDKWKTFMCHNLGADESSNPFVPSFATNGAYYQWGRKDQAKSAPNVSGADVTNITWNTQTPTGYFGNNTDNPDVTVKSQYDPCPTGFRIPSYSEWEGVIKYNKASYVGTWTTTDCISCWAGVQLGHGLMLPAAGNRANPIGAVFERSRLGAYWSTRTKSDMANVMHISGNNIAMSAIYKQVGYSVRCIAE
jgi:uncharacterized protein (TIGR02145 family)